MYRKLHEMSMIIDFSYMEIAWLALSPKPKKKFDQIMIKAYINMPYEKNRSV